MRHCDVLQASRRALLRRIPAAAASLALALPVRGRGPRTSRLLAGRPTRALGHVLTRLVMSLNLKLKSLQELVQLANKALGDLDARNRLAEYGLLPLAPQEPENLVKQDLDHFGPLVNSLGLVAN